MINSHHNLCKQQSFMILIFYLINLSNFNEIVSWDYEIGWFTKWSVDYRDNDISLVEEKDPTTTEFGKQ
jgi:hypothetical protein